ncbi:MAG: protein translocase subunit SecF, partial [Flavobacteriales bacterium]
IQDPGSQQYYPGKGPSCGYAHLKDTATVNALLKRKDILSKFPPRIRFAWAAKAYDDNGEYLQLYALKVTTRNGKARLEGDAVTNARVQADPMGNPEVSLIMNSDGAQTWRLMTKENIGKSIAIVLDNLVYSAPTVQGEISGGRSSITGRFTQEEAADLSNVLKAGKLPAPSKIIEEAVVGPSLGQEAISAGLQSFLIALCIVLIYMWFYYAKGGAVADVALFVNLFLVIGVLASIGATLTLPGIAGIVLTIGMSVDANVLIFERIREETAAGKGIRLAIVDGYKAAYSSIIDANITTLLTGVILSIFGTGPIKGFATTLIIGILTSLFSAIFITRLLFEWMLNKNIKLTFGTKLTANAFKNINWGFVKNRKKFYLISSLIILCGIGSLFYKGLNQGVDFTGGRSYIVRFEHIVDAEAIRKALGDVFISDKGLKQPPEVKIFGASNQVKITTKFMIDDNGEKVDEIVEKKLHDGLSKLQSEYEIMSSQKVGPTIADDIKVAAAWSVFFSLLIIFLYLLMRFKKWQYGLGALVALIHDVLIVIGVFSIFYGILPFSLEIDQAFIAAILTVVGYSINDTVVVFDRIREFFGLYKRKERHEVINNALNSTLSRTVNTSLTTFFVLLMIFIFGGEVIRGFVFALMVGVVVGTYSSVCIATPIVVDFGKKQADKSRK